MPFPKNLEELKNKGYKFDGPGKCKGCGADIEWWKTPSGRSMPIVADGKGNIVAHWSNCPNAEEFRK